ncbi:unnamed protein product, partial [Rotaria socialis]
MSKVTAYGAPSTKAFKMGTISQSHEQEP